MRKYELGEELTALNGNGLMNNYEFTGTVVGFAGEDYLVTYEHGWELYEQKKVLYAFDIDDKYIGTKMWHVPANAIKKTEAELIAEKAPSNELMSHLVTATKSADGNHAECYPHPKDRKKILLATNCPVRRIMAKGNFVGSTYFPKPRVAGKLGTTNVYEMDKYLPYHEGRHKLSKLDNQIYRELVHRFGGCVESLKRLNIPETVKKEIARAYNAVKREGYTVDFDICDHNMMVSPKGKLVFTDLFWVYKRDYEGKKK